MNKFDVTQFVIRRNKSWIDSVMLGLQATIWFAPTTLLRATWLPLYAAVCGALLAIAMVFGWLITRIAILIAGFAGYVSPLKPQGKS